MEISAGKLWGLRRLADDAGYLKMLAVDQRPPIQELIAERRHVAVAPEADVRAVKALLTGELASRCSAVLLDPHFAFPAAVDRVSPRQGLLLTLEDSVFVVAGTGGRRSKAIDDWSVEKIKRAGADAVKLLAWYHPDAAPEVSEHQQHFVADVGDACRRYDITFVLELLAYPLPGARVETHDRPGAGAPSAKRADQVLASVETFAAPEFGVDLFKLESPWPPAAMPDFDVQSDLGRAGVSDRVSDGGAVSELAAADDALVARMRSDFDALGRLAGRPWVILSAGATKGQFRRVLRLACDAGASGYLAGRAIWWDAFRHFPDEGAMRDELRQDAVPYVDSLNELTDARAVPWTDHPCFGGHGVRVRGATGGFCASYDGFGDDARVVRG